MRQLLYSTMRASYCTGRIGARQLLRSDDNMRPTRNHEATHMNQRTIRRAQLAEMLGVCPSTIDRKLAAGQLPEPIRLSKRTMFWLPETIEAWLKERAECAQVSKA